MSRLFDYIRLVKPRQSLLLTYTGSATYYFASGGAGIMASLIFFTLGLVAAMGSNTLNSFADRDLDRLMQRTRSRPLPKGLISPLSALIIGLLMVLTSSASLYLLFNGLSAGLALFGAAYYVLFYTLYLKKVSPFGVIIGGLAGSIPTLTGWAAAKGSIGVEAALLSGIVFLWSTGHFWSLAIRYRDEYSQANLPVLPVVAGVPRAVAAVVGFNLSTLVMIAVSIFMIGGLPYKVLASLASVMLLSAAFIIILKLDEGGAWLAYKISSPTLALIFTGLLLS